MFPPGKRDTQTCPASLGRGGAGRGSVSGAPELVPVCGSRCRHAAPGKVLTSASFAPCSQLCARSRRYVRARAHAQKPARTGLHAYMAMCSSRESMCKHACVCSALTLTGRETARHACVCVHAHSPTEPVHTCVRHCARAQGDHACVHAHREMSWMDTLEEGGGSLTTQCQL